MLIRTRRHPKALSVVLGVALTSLGLVVLGVWWIGGESHLPLPHHHHHQSIDGANVSKFIDSARHLVLHPAKVLQACGGDNGGGGGGQGVVEVVVMVPSSPNNLPARSAIRESWATYLPSTWALVFYVGAVDRPSVQESLAVEAQAHRDIAQDFTFPDSYSTLTLKTLALLSWAHSACPSAKFVLKADDDVYVNVPRLQALVGCLGWALTNTYVERKSNSNSAECEWARELVSHYVDAVTHRYESYVIGGYLYQRVRPDRSPTSKWHLPKTSYPDDVLPPYLSGTAYLLSANLIPHLLEAARNTPAVTLEDVYLTGLVGSKHLKLRLGHLDGFERFRPRWESACVYHSLSTAHGFAPGELRVTTHKALGLPDGACNGVLTRVGLALNAIVTSVFPRLPSPSSLLLDDTDIRAVI